MKTPPLLEKSIQTARDLKNAVQAAADLNDKTDLEMDSIQLDDLSQRIHNIDTTLQETSKDRVYLFRDLLGLDHAIQRL